MSRRSKRQHKRGTKPLAAQRTESNPYAWMLTGLDDSKKRGTDQRHSRQDFNAQQIDTERRRDPIFFRAVDYYDKLPLGTGLKLESENATVLQAAKRFWRGNDLDSLQHQIAIELATTANVFAWIPAGDKPAAADIMRFTPSIELIPTGQINRIATKNGRAWYYRRSWEDQEYPDPDFDIRKGQTGLVGLPVWRQQDISAGEMIHVAINRSAHELRGVSMLQPALYWSKLYARSLKMVYVHSVAKAWLALHIKVSGMSSGDPQLKALKDEIEAGLILQTDPSGEQYKALGVGQATITGEDVEMNVLSSKVGADSDDGEKRRLLLMAATAAGLPECFLSDGDYSNLASASTQSNPFFRLMQSHQATLIQVFERIFRLAFDRYFAAGWFINVPLGDGMTHVSDLLKITAPDILAPDIVELAPAITQLTAGKVMSLQTAASKLGLDWEEEKRQMEAEKQAGLVAPAPMAPGGFPGLPALPFSAAAGGNGETRIETDDLADKMKERSRKAVVQFRNAMDELGQTSRDKTRAMELYLAFVKELKSILKGSIDKGEKLGKIQAAPEAAKIPAEEEGVLT